MECVRVLQLPPKKYEKNSLAPESLLERAMICWDGRSWTNEFFGDALPS